MSKKQLGVGLDLGTMNIVAARQGGSGIDIRRIRDAFLDLDDIYEELSRS